MAKKVIISGITGQDGSYMAEYLLKNTDNIVIGGVRRTSQAILSNLKDIIDNPRLKLITVDLTDGEAVRKLIREENPDYFINFGAQTYVADSWNHPIAHMNANAMSIIHLLEAIREYVPNCRFYSAGSSEQFGDVKESPQTINTPPSPRSPYGVSKVAAGFLVKVYRETHGLYAVHGILFNHESERRQEYFVSRKITKNVVRIKKELDAGKLVFPPLELGNLDAVRDWSHAEDFMDGVWRMLNQDEYKKIQAIGHMSEEAKTKWLAKYQISEYVLASGNTHSVREFVEKAFQEVGIKGKWENLTKDAKGEEYVLDTPKSLYIPLVRINPKFYRPAEVDLLLGDATPAREELGWEPKITFQNLVRRMVKHDLND